MKYKNSKDAGLLNFSVNISFNFKTILILNILLYGLLIYSIINRSNLAEMTYFYEIPNSEAIFDLLFILLAVVDIYFFLKILVRFQSKKIKIFSIVMLILSFLALAYFIFAFFFIAYFL